MSTEKGAAKRRSSRSEGTSTESGSNTPGLCGQQKQQQRSKEIPSTTPISSSSSSSQSNLKSKAVQDDENDGEQKAQDRGAVTTTVGETQASAGKKTIATKTELSILSEDDTTRQVIAVSANKNPTAFFQLARKFLMTNDMCDLSALEGAIVSAVDAAHLLERSQLASIVRIHTSYVSVEPKRRRQQQQIEIPYVNISSSEIDGSKPNARDIITASTATAAVADPASTPASVSNMSKGKTALQNTRQGGYSRSTSSSGGGGGSRELRRARILITVKRTESYKRWLDENPLQRQAIIEGEDIADSNVTGPPPSYHHKEENLLEET